MTHKLVKSIVVISILLATIAIGTTTLAQSPGDGATIPEARQTDTPGGFHLIKVAYAWGYGNVHNDGGKWSDWIMDGNGKRAKRLTMTDFHVICRQVYGYGYKATRVGNGANDVRCILSGGGGQTQQTPQPPTGSNCSPLPSRVRIGNIAFNNSGVTLHPKYEPKTSSANKFELPVNAQISIIAGPVCGENRTWWKISYRGQEAWLPEANANVYNISAGSTSGDEQQETCQGAITPRMVVGQRGRVTYTDGTPTALREVPQGKLIVQLPEGTEFSVLAGPTCTQAQRGHLNWWQVRTDDDLVGWISEGYADMPAFIEPLPPKPQTTLENISITMDDGSKFVFKFNRKTYEIPNGSEFVISELRRLSKRISQVPSVTTRKEMVISYAFPGTSSKGELERIHDQLLEKACRGVELCEYNLGYLIGEQYMDASGIGNIIFGYFCGALNAPIRLDDWTSGVTQSSTSLDPSEIVRFSDNPVDIAQRRIGRMLYDNSGGSPSLKELEKIAGNMVIPLS